tara:strand:+ start:136 stop:408 length:273 start_codon:yes stop_codon:yes gene_type:complete
MPDDARLERMEKKLDQVGDAIVALARMEERMITMFKRLDSLDSKQGADSRRLTVVEGKVGTNGQYLRFAERVFWIVIAASITYAFNAGVI